MLFRSNGEEVSLHQLWNRRHTTKFNGVAYPVQKAAAAIYSEEGKREIRTLTDFYMENASLILETMKGLGFACAGGTNAPYVWIKTDMPSWDFFDKLLNECAIVCTPGAGFGSCGEGHFRLSAFNTRSNVEKAMERIGKEKRHILVDRVEDGREDQRRAQEQFQTTLEAFKAVTEIGRAHV